MNRKKLERRTQLAAEIAGKWRWVRLFNKSYRSMYARPNWWTLLGPEGLRLTDYQEFPGGRTIRETFVFVEVDRR